MAFASIDDIADGPEKGGVASLSDIADEKQTKSGVASLDDIAPARKEFPAPAGTPGVPKPTAPAMEGVDVLTGMSESEKKAFVEGRGGLPGSFEGHPENLAGAVETVAAPIQENARAAKNLIQSESKSMDPNDPANRLQGITVPGVRGPGKVTRSTEFSPEQTTSAYKNVVAPAGEAGADFIEGMGSPENLMMMGAFSAVPVTTTAGKLFHGAIGAYFGGKMGVQGFKDAYAAYEQAQGGNVPEAVKQAFSAALNLGMAGAGVKGVVDGAVGAGKDYGKNKFTTARGEMIDEATKQAVEKAGGNPDDVLDATRARRAAERAASEAGVPQVPNEGIGGIPQNISQARKMQSVTEQARAKAAQQASTPPDPAAVAVENRLAEAAQSMARANAKELPPPPPPPPAEPVTDQHIEAAKEMVKNLPPEQQSVALVEAHQKLAEGIAQGGALVNGKFVAPGSKSAPKVAEGIINDAIKEHDAQNAPESVLSLSTEEASPSTKPAQSSQEGAVASQESAKEDAGGFVPGTHAAKAADALRSEGMKDVRVSIHSDENQALAAEDQIKHNGETIVSFHVPGIDSTMQRYAKDVDTPEKVQAVVAEKQKEFENSPNKTVEGIKARQQSAISKGDRVSTKDGTGTVVWKSPDEKLGGVRIKMDSGETINVHKKDVKALSEDFPGKPDVNVRRMNPAIVSTDPSRMQWRIMPREGIDSSAPFDLDKAGTIDVMRDPDNPGKLLTIDGHHRQTHALNTSAPEARYEMHPEFTSVKQARIWGAIRNIENGNAEPFDAARFIRDIGPEEFAKQNINKNSELMRKGMALARLSDGVWEQYRSGDLDEAKAIAIGKSSDDPSQQGFLAKTAKEQKMSAAEIESFSRRMSERGGSSDKVQTLFGEQSNSLAGEVRRARIASKIEKLLEQEKNALKYVSNEARARVLARAKNVIDVNESSKQALSASVLAETFRKVQNRTGAVADVLDEASKEEKPDVEEIYPRVLEALKADLDRSGVGSSEQVSGQSKGAGSSRSSDAKADEDHPVTPEGAGELFRTADPFYLKSEQLISSKMPNRASGEDVRNLLVNNGVKADEMKWTGLDDFLRGKLSVTKQQVQDFLRENNVQIKEVTLGGGTVGSLNKPTELTKPIFDELNSLLQKDDLGGYDSLSEARNGIFAHLEGRDANDWSPETVAKAREYVAARGGNPRPAKFSQYTLPGGENYRELLMTLPQKPEPTEGYYIAKDAGAFNVYDGRHGIGQFLTMEEAQDFLRSKLGNNLTKRNFKSSHFDEPNILAHVRMNDRTGADGKRTLFVEEVQSDWHQKGRKQGYKTGDPKNFSEWMKERGLETKISEEWYKQSESPHWRLWNQEHSLNTSGVPDAPFKTNWHELALKRVLRYAAENGYDKIAWTTGEQQNARYDLSKQVSKVEWRPRIGDTEQGRLYAYDHTGKPVIAEDMHQSKVEDYIGKDVAKRLLESETIPSETGRRDSKQLSGVQLSIGGSGMKGFYDKIIPDFLNKYGKKWGAKVGDTKISTTDFGARGRQALIDEGKWDPKHDSFSTTVHSLDITPSMKQSVMEEGQPLFRGDALQRDAAIAQKARAEFRPASKNRPAAVALNEEARRLLSGIANRNMVGVRVPTATANAYILKLNATAGKIVGAHPEAAKAIRAVATSIRKAISSADPQEGVILFEKGNANAEVEETIHAGQAVAGGGSLAVAAPVEMAKHPAFAAMEPRIQEENGGKLSPLVHVLEGFVDLVTGEAPEVADSEVRSALDSYADALAEKAGTAALDVYSGYLEAVRQIYAENGKEVPNGITHAEEAIRSARGREEESARLHGERDNGDSLRRSARDRGQSGRTSESREGSKGEEELARPQGQGLDDHELESWIRGGRSIEVREAGEQATLLGEPEKMYQLIRSDSKGDIEKHLVSESQYEKLQNFKPFNERVSAGKQQGMFGNNDGEIVGSGKRGGIELPPQASDSQGTLFRSSLFGLDIAAEKIAKVAGPVSSMIADSLKEEAGLIKGSRDLHEGIYDLEKMQEADQLRVKQAVDESTIAAKDDAAIYHWLENPAGERLTPAQQKIYDTNIKPFMDEAERIITKLRGAGALVNNYVHREVKDSGSWLDKVLSGANKSKGGGKGNILSKSAPSTKGRTMMAMENEDGKRLVVSVKGGKVTAWDSGMGIDMGGLRAGLTTKEGQLHEQIAPINRELKKLREEKRILSETPGRIKTTFQRRKNLSIQIEKLEREREALVNSVGLNELKDQSFIDKNGREWKFDQATTKEIEADTKLKYHHSALGSAATNFLSLRKAERAFDFVEELKNDPGFASIAKKVTDGQAPEGWRQSNIPQLMGYAFEPHHREVLDWYAKKLNSSGPTALEKVGAFLRTAIFFNPLLHVPNLAVHAYVEKGQLGTGGATALLKPKSWRAAAKAVNAVMHQNEDYLAALDEGAPLQSHRDDLRNLNKAIFEKVGKELDADGKLAENIGKALGYANPINFLKAWYKLSGYVTWHANDIAYLQAAYEKVEDGMSLRDALKETGKHIPTYRLPTRVLGSRGLAQFMNNPLTQQFSAYHYGALKSYGQAIKSAIGHGERPAEEEAENPNSAGWKEVAHGWDILATIGLVTFALYPMLSNLVKKASGDDAAELRRAGASTFPYNLYLLSKGERTPTQVMESVFTPSVMLKRGTEFAFNRNLQTGRQLYDPHAPAKTLAKQIGREMGSSISPIDQATRAMGDDESRKKALWSLAGVSFPKRGAAKLAQEIAMGKVGTQAMDPGEKDKYYARKEAIESARKGDYSPLYDAVGKGLIRHDQVKEIKQEAKEPPLLHTVKNFSYGEFMRVWEVATPEEKQMLNKERIAKRHNMLKKGRRGEVSEADATE